MALTKVIGSGTGDITKLQILNGSNVNTASTDADDLIIEGPNDCGLSILSATTGRIFFGDASNDDAGSIRYVHSDDSMRFEANDEEAMRIHSIGAITKPLQPAFQVHPASQQNNLTVNAYTTIAFGTEVFDNNLDFASNTFTAPVTGKYQLNLIIYFLSIDIDANYWQINLETSNRTYYQVIVPKFSADLAYHNFAMTVLADMDANDTSYLRIYQAGGDAQTDIAVATTFSGYLVC